MMFVTPRLRVILASTHIPLSAVPGAITVESLVRTITVGTRR
jgi:4-hydroxythreonine-4-phosphate dehydrogenase